MWKIIRPITSKRLQKTYHDNFNEILKYVAFNPLNPELNPI